METRFDRVYRQLFLRMPGIIQEYLPHPLEAVEDRNAASHLLYAMGEEAVSAVPELMEMLAVQDHEIKKEIILILKAMGPSAASAMKELRKILNEPDEVLRLIAWDAMAAIEPEMESEMLTAQVKALESGDPSIRWTAIQLLCERDRQREKIVSVLSGILNEYRSRWEEGPQSWEALVACRILMDWNESAREAVPALVRQLDAPEGMMRFSSAKALSRIAPDVETDKVKEIMAKREKVEKEVDQKNNLYRRTQ